MATQKLATTVLQLTTDASSAYAELDKFDRRVKSSGTGMLESFAKNAKSVGAGLTAGVTAPLLALGAASIAAGVKLDNAFDTIRIGTGATGKDLKALEGSFKAVFKGVPNDAGEVATAIADINTRTGATGPALEGLATQLLTLSRISKTEVGPLIASTTRLFGDWSVATEKQSGTLDFLFRASQSTGIGVDTLADKLTQFGAPLRQMGFDIEESAAMLGKWEKEGVNAELVLGSLRIAALKFAEANVPLEEGLNATIEAIKTSTVEQGNLLAKQVFGAKAAGDMAAAIREGRFEYDDLVTSLRDGTETIAGAAADTDGFAEKWLIVRNNLTVALEPLGTRLLDVLEDLQPLLLRGAETVARLGEWFANLSPTSQAAIIGIAGVGAVAGPAIFLIGSLVEKMITLSGTAKSLGVALNTLKVAALSPMGLALIGIGTGFVLAKRDMDAYFARVEEKNAAAREQAELMEAYRKTTGATGDVLLDFNRLTDEQKQKLRELGAAAGEGKSQVGGLSIALDTAKQGLDRTGQAAGDATPELEDYRDIIGQVDGHD